MVKIDVDNLGDVVKGLQGKGIRFKGVEIDRNALVGEDPFKNLTPVVNGDIFKGKRGTVKLGSRQRVKAYRELLECMTDMKWQSIRNAFHRKGLKLSSSVDVAEFIKQRLDANPSRE